MKSTKSLGQVFTPDWVVKMMLDGIGYNNKEILHKRILEPSCGDGAFLKEIVRRFIEIAKDEKLFDEEIISLLQNNIVGIELDLVAYEKAIENLNAVVDRYRINGVQWNILNQDALGFYDEEGFDYIVGNPPYVRIHNLSQKSRDIIKTQYTFSKGMLELYIIFYELAFKNLKSSGKMSYITPNSFLRNENAKEFRKFLIDKKCVAKIIDFGSEKVFNAGTYTAIVELTGEGSKKEFFQYITGGRMGPKEITEIDVNLLSESNWNLSSLSQQEFLKDKVSDTNNVSTLVNVQYSLATLRDRIYISSDIQEIGSESELVLFNGHLIEKSILSPVVKASKYSGEDIKSKIIWPYYSNNNDSVLPILEDELKEKYPYAYQYFLVNKEELMKRDMDKNCKTWYQYGRSQGINNMKVPKIVFKHVLKGGTTVNNIECYLLDSDVVVYSGIFATDYPSFQGGINKAKEVIESTDFFKYVFIVGKDMSGGYKSFSVSQLKRFAL